MNRYKNSLGRCLIGCCGVVALGSVGFTLIENWPVSDSLYMTVITMSTVGYGETQQLSPLGRLFACCLIVVSICVMTLTTSYFTSFLVSGNLNGRYFKRRMLKMAARLRGHTIVCGTGMIAQVILDRLLRCQLPVVVIGDNPEQVTEIRRRFPDVTIVEGSPKSELSLADANILYAKTVVATLENEFDNLLISMTAKELSGKIRVIARAEDPQLAGRLVKAGVDNVICPFLITGELAADLVTNEI